MDRRSLLKSATLSAAAVAVAPIASVTAMPEAAAPIIAPAKLSPYANYVWEWFVSHDGCTYYKAFPTKEEAIEYAKRSEYSIVAECLQQDFNLEVDGYWLIEHLNERNEELIGEGDGLSPSNEQELDLEEMVKRAVEAWVIKHNINIRAWTFVDTRNETDVPLSADAT